ncbi:MAG: hypothetical protein EZS28_055965, partial [Streblomastix strix]
GYNIENDEEIHNILFNTSNFIGILHEGRDDRNNPKYGALPELRRRCDEEYEEEGGNEEIESFLMNKRKILNGTKLMDDANTVKESISNYFKHKTNKPRDQNDDDEEEDIESDSSDQDEQGDQNDIIKETKQNGFDDFDTENYLKQFSTSQLSNYLSQLSLSSSS